MGCNLVDGNQENNSNSKQKKTKRNFVMVFMETTGISVMVSIFFQQGNDTRTVLHIIDNIELKFDCKKKITHLQIKSQCQKRNCY